MNKTTNNPQFTEMIIKAKATSYFNIVVDKFYYHVNENWDRMMELANKIEAEGPSKRWETKEQQLAWTIARELKYTTWNFLPYTGDGVFTLNDDELNALFIAAFRSVKKMLTE